MTIVIFLIGFVGASLVLLSGLAFFRSKDVFTMTHVVMIFCCYALPITLLAIEFEKFSVTSLIKILLLIALNFIVVNLICYIATKQAIANGVTPDIVAEISK